jgi:hypothetical protein
MPQGGAVRSGLSPRNRANAPKATEAWFAQAQLANALRDWLKAHPQVNRI